MYVIHADFPSHDEDGTNPGMVVIHDDPFLMMKMAQNQPYVCDP
jgi:hypothetical protein